MRVTVVAAKGRQDFVPVDCFPFFLISVCGSNPLICIMKIKK